MAKNKSAYRTVTRRSPAGDWRPCAFEALRVGDRFRLYEGPPHEPVFYCEATVDTPPEPCPPAGNYTLGAVDVSHRPSNPAST